MLLGKFSLGPHTQKQSYVRIIPSQLAQNPGWALKRELIFINVYVNVIFDI